MRKICRSVSLTTIIRWPLPPPLLPACLAFFFAFCHARLLLELSAMKSGGGRRCFCRSAAEVRRGAFDGFIFFFFDLNVLFFYFIISLKCRVAALFLSFAFAAPLLSARRILLGEDSSPVLLFVSRQREGWRWWWRQGSSISNREREREEDEG